MIWGQKSAKDLELEISDVPVCRKRGNHGPRKISVCRWSANRVSARDRGSILIIKTQESSANLAN